MVARIEEQSAVVPWRIRDGVLEVLLVTSRSGRRWILPKGDVPPHLSPASSAAREALEEAGVEGRLDERPLGAYTVPRGDHLRRVEVYPLAVETMHARWLEEDRDRRWLPFGEAVERLEEAAARALVRTLPLRLATGG